MIDNLLNKIHLWLFKECRNYRNHDFKIWEKKLHFNIYYEDPEVKYFWKDIIKETSKPPREIKKYFYAHDITCKICGKKI